MKGNHIANNPRRAFDGLSHYRAGDPCQNLWKAVIAQHLQDLASRSKSMEAVFNKREAEDFFFSQPRMLQTICDYAGYSVEYVTAAARKVKKTGMLWKAHARLGTRYAEYVQRKEGKWKPKKTRSRQSASTC